MAENDEIDLTSFEDPKSIDLSSFDEADPKKKNEGTTVATKQGSILDRTNTQSNGPTSVNTPFGKTLDLSQAPSSAAIQTYVDKKANTFLNHPAKPAPAPFKPRGERSELSPAQQKANQTIAATGSSNIRTPLQEITDATFGKPNDLQQRIVDNAENETRGLAPVNPDEAIDTGKRVNENIGINKIADYVEKQDTPNAKVLADELREKNKSWNELPLEGREEMRSWAKDQATLEASKAIDADEKRLSSAKEELKKLNESSSMFNFNNSDLKANIEQRKKLDDEIRTLNTKLAYNKMRPDNMAVNIFKDDDDVINGLKDPAAKFLDQVKENDPEAYRRLAASLYDGSLSPDQKTEIIKGALNVSNQELSSKINFVKESGAVDRARDYTNNLSEYNSKIKEINDIAANTVGTPSLEETGKLNILKAEASQLKSKIDDMDAAGVDKEVLELNKINNTLDRQKEIVAASSLKYDLFKDQEKQADVDKFVEDNPIAGRIWNVLKKAGGLPGQFLKTGAELGEQAYNKTGQLLGRETETGAYDKLSGRFSAVDLFDSLIPTQANLAIVGKDGNVKWENVINGTANTLGDMAVLLAGGAEAGTLAKAAGAGEMAGGIGLMMSSYAQARPDYFDHAIEAGMAPKDAALFSDASAVLTSALELISPNKALFGEEAKREFTQEFAKYYAKDGWKFAFERSADRLYKEILPENVQELSQLLGDKVVEYAANKVYNKEIFDADIKASEVKETVLMTTLATGILTGVRNKSLNREEKQDYILQAAQNFDTFQKTIGDLNLNPQDEQAITAVVEKYHKAITAMPEGLNPNVVKDVAPLLVSKQTLAARANAENVDDAFKADAKRKIAVIDNAIIGLTDGRYTPEQLNITDNPSEAAATNTEQAIEARQKAPNETSDVEQNNQPEIGQTVGYNLNGQSYTGTLKEIKENGEYVVTRPDGSDYTTNALENVKTENVAPVETEGQNNTQENFQEAPSGGNLTPETKAIAPAVIEQSVPGIGNVSLATTNDGNYNVTFEDGSTEFMTPQDVQDVLGFNPAEIVPTEEKSAESTKGILSGNNYTTPDGTELQIQLTEGARGKVNSVDDLTDKNRFSMVMYDPNNKVNPYVGNVSFWRDTDGKYFSNMTRVDEKYRRMGIATAMYDFARNNGIEIKSSNEQTAEGVDFANNYFNEQKQFTENNNETLPIEDRVVQDTSVIPELYKGYNDIDQQGSRVSENIPAESETGNRTPERINHYEKARKSVTSTVNFTQALDSFNDVINDRERELTSRMREISDLNDIKIFYYNIAEPGAVSGFFNTGSRTIFINDAYNSAPEKKLKTLLHEVMHYYTSDALDRFTYGRSANENEKKIASEINSLFEQAKKIDSNRKFYGTTNIDEFVTEAYTNPEFQKFLSQHKFDTKFDPNNIYEDDKLTLWQKFVDAIYRLFTGKRKYDPKSASENYIHDVIFDLMIVDNEERVRRSQPKPPLPGPIPLQQLESKTTDELEDQYFQLVSDRNYTASKTVKIRYPDLKSIDDELRRRERSSILNFEDPASGIAYIDNLANRKKVYISAKDAAATREVLEKYIDATQLNEEALLKDFKGSLLLSSKSTSPNPVSIEATLNLSVNEMKNRGISNNELLAIAYGEFQKFNFKVNETNEKINRILNPILNEKKIAPNSIQQANNEVRDAYNDLENRDLPSEPEEEFNRNNRLVRALSNLAIKYIREGVNTVADFAKRIGRAVDENITKAYNIAKESISRNPSDPSAEVINQLPEMENAVDEDGVPVRGKDETIGDFARRRAAYNASQQNADINGNPIRDNADAVDPQPVREEGEPINVYAGRLAAWRMNNIPRTGPPSSVPPGVPGSTPVTGPSVLNNWTLPPETKMERRVRRNVDFLNRLRKAIEVIKTFGGNIPETSDPYIQHAFLGSRAEQQITELVEKIVKNNIKGGTPALFQRVSDAGISIQNFGLFTYAQHAQERNEYNARSAQEAYDAEVARVQIDRDANLRNGKSTQYQDNRLRDLAAGKIEKFKLIPDGGSGMFTADAEAILQTFSDDNTFSQLEAFAEEYRNAVTREDLAMQLKNGLITQEDFDNINKAFKYYVPLQVAEYNINKTVPAIKSLDKIRKNLQRSKGSVNQDFTKRINPVLMGMVKTETSIIQSIKNSWMGQLRDLIEQNPNDDVWQVVRPRYTPTYDKYGNVTGMKSSLDPKLEKEYIRAFKDGREYFIHIKDETLRNAVTQKNVIKADSVPVIKQLNKINTFYRTFYTQINPDFLLANVFRDVQEGTLMLSEKDAKGLKRAFLKSIPSSAKTIYQYQRGERNTPGAKRFEEYLQSGAKITFASYDQSLDKMRKMADALDKNVKGGNILKRGGLALYDGLKAYSEVAELSTRFSIYDTMIKKGFSETDAATTSRNATIDFNKKGEWTSYTNAMFLFLNAGTQGGYNAVRLLARSPQARRFMGYVFAAGFALTALNTAMGGDEPEDEEDNYWGIPEFDRQTNLIIKKPFSKGFYKIPLGRTLALPFYAGSESYGLVTGKQEIGKAVTSTAINMLGVLNPFGSSEDPTMAVVPTAIKPLVQFGRNKNGIGSPIYVDRNFGAGRPDSFSSFKSNTAASKWVAETLNTFSKGNAYESGAIDISPGTIDFAFSTAFGGTGKFLKKLGTYSLASGQEATAIITGDEQAQEAASKELAQNRPIISRFETDGKPKSYKSLIYQTLEESSTNKLKPKEVKLFQDVLVKAVENNEIDKKQFMTYNKQIIKNQLRIDLAREYPDWTETEMKVALDQVF